MNESLAAEGVLTSAAPELPLSDGNTIPTALSPVEGEVLGLPAGSAAKPEVKPLYGVAEVPPPRQVQNNSYAYLPGLGQEYLLTARQLVAASALQLQSPRSSSLLADLRTSKECQEPSEEPTAATPNAEQSRVPSRAGLPLVGLSPFSPSGPQSTHGSSVGMGSPHTLSRDEVTQRRSGGNTTARPGLSSPMLGSLLAMAKATRQFVKARADALLSPGVFPGGLEPSESALPGLVDPSHPVPTLAETRGDATNVQPHLTYGTVTPPDPEQTIVSDGSSIPSLLAPGIQGREAPPISHLSAGIRREVVTPHAKALASVSSLPTLVSQVDALTSIGIRSDQSLISLSDSEVAHTSQPRIGIQPGRATTEIQGEPVSHLPTLPLLPTTDSPDDLLLTGIRNDAVAPLPSSSVVAHASQPEIGIQLRRVATSAQSAQSPLSLPLTPDGSSPDVANIRRLLLVSPDISADILTDISRPSSLIPSDQSSIGIRSGLLSAPSSQSPLSLSLTPARSLSDVANIRQLSLAPADIPADISADIALPSSLISSDQPSVGIRSGLLSAPPSLSPALSAATLTSPDVTPLSSLPLSFVPLTAPATPLSPVPPRDAVPPPAVPGLTSGGPACRSDPLLQSPPLPSLPSLSQPPPLSPSPSLPVSLLPSATLPSLISSPDVVLPPATAGLAPGGPVCRSDPLPQPPPLLSLPSSPQPPPLSPSLLSPVPSLMPATLPPPVLSPDAALSSAISGLLPGAPAARSDPLPQPLLSQPPLLSPEPPPSSPSPLSSVPLLSPAMPLPVAASSGAAPSSAVPGLVPGGQAARSDPLPQSLAPQSSITPHQPQLLSPPPLSSVLPWPHATSSPSAAPPSAALPSTVAALAPRGLEVPNDPMPQSLPLQPLPSLPQSPSLPPIPPPPVSASIPPLSPATMSPPATSGEAVMPSAAAQYAPGSPKAPSDPLPLPQSPCSLLAPSLSPLQSPPLALSVPPPPPATSLPHAARAGAALLPAVPPIVPSARNGRSGLAGPPTPPSEDRMPDEVALDVTYIHPQSNPETSTVPPPDAVPFRIAPLLTPDAPGALAPDGPGAPLGLAVPPTSPSEDRMPDEVALDVTYIYPQSTPETKPQTSTVPPPDAVPVQIVPLLTPNIPAPGDPDAQNEHSDLRPLPQSSCAALAPSPPPVPSLPFAPLAPPLPLATSLTTPAPSDAALQPVTPGALAPDGPGAPLGLAVPPTSPSEDRTPVKDLLDVTYIYLQDALEATPRQPSVPSDAAPQLAAPGAPAPVGPGALLEPAVPPTPPPEDVIPTKDLLDVTYIYPQDALEATPRQPSIPSDAALQPVTTGALVPSGPGALLQVQNEHLVAPPPPRPLPSPPMPQPPPPPPVLSALPPSDVTVAGAAQLSSTGQSASSGPAGRSDPLTASAAPIQDKSLVRATNVRPQGSLPVPLPNSTTSVTSVLLESDEDCPDGALCSDTSSDTDSLSRYITELSASYHRSDTSSDVSTPPSQSSMFPLPLTSPPNTGDGWRCRCQPHQNWEDRRRCGECRGLWCAACAASQCRCEPEFFPQGVVPVWVTLPIVPHQPEIASPPPSPADTPSEDDDTLSPILPLPPPVGAPAQLAAAAQITPGSLFGPPADPSASSLFALPAELAAPVAPVAPPAAAQTELPKKPLRPLSAAFSQKETSAGSTRVHLPDALSTLPVEPSIPVASAELPAKPRRSFGSFGPASRAKPSAVVASAHASESPPGTSAGLAGALVTTPDDVLALVATVKEDAQAELPAKPTRGRPTQQPAHVSPDDSLNLIATQKEEVQSELPAKPARSQSLKQPPPPAEEAALDEGARAALAEEKRLTKNAKARAYAAEKKRAALPPVEVVGDLARNPSLHLLGEFDKASDSTEAAAKGRSSFTKQAAGVPRAILAKVTSGRPSSVSIPSTTANSGSDSANDDGTSDGLSDVGGDTYEPVAGEYVQVKMTCKSVVRGRILLVHRVRGVTCTLRQIGAANVPGAKKFTLGAKALHNIKRSGITVDIYLNKANLQDYLNLLVENPTLPAVPPPNEPEEQIPPTPTTVVPEPLRLLLPQGIKRTSYPHDLSEEVQPTLPLTAVHGVAHLPLRRLPSSYLPTSSSSSTAACSTTPKPPRTSSSSTANVSFQSATSLSSATPPPLPEGTAPGSFVSARAPPAGAVQKTQPARASSTSSVPSRPPNRKTPDTTVDPRDPLFEPPTEGILHYRDAAGNIHVITAPGVYVPSTYRNVDVKTSEQAVALHEAAQAATAAAAEALAAQTRLEKRASTSTPAISSVLLSEKEQFVLPKSLRTPGEQALAVKTMKALHDQVDCGQKQALANTQEINDLLAQVQELYGEKGQLVEERDQLMESNAQLCEERTKLAEQSRLELGLHQQPEAVAALEDAVAGWTARCEELVEQQNMSAAVVDNANARVEKAEKIMHDALSSHSATREAAANLEESNAQLSRQLTAAEHRLQSQQDRVDELTRVEEQVEELQAEHLQQLAAAERDREQTEDEWHEALDAAEARENILLAEAAAAAEDCERHKAQLQQQLKEARAVAEALEKQLREFDETAAAATAAAEAEHDQREADLQGRLELQTDLLQKSDVALHAANSKREKAEVRLRKSNADLNAATEELATAQGDHALAIRELTDNSDQLLLLVEQLKGSAAAAALESNQKQEEQQIALSSIKEAHQIAISSLRRQLDQLRSITATAEERRVAALEELDLLRLESAASKAECEQVRGAAHDTRTTLQAECTRLQAECTQLQSKARPCTTCDGADGQGPEDDCPAELAAALQRLQLAEDYITELSASYDSLTDITLVKLAERDAKSASALSALALREADLVAARATIASSSSDFTAGIAAIQASLASRDAELATLHPLLAQLRASANLAEEEWRARQAKDDATMVGLRTATALAENEWKECHAKQEELERELFRQQNESIRISELACSNGLNDLFYPHDTHLPSDDVPTGPDTRRKVNFRVESSPLGEFPSDPDTPHGRVVLLDRLPRDSPPRPPHTSASTLAAAIAAAQRNRGRSATPPPLPEEDEDERPPVTRPRLTTGSPNVGVTEAEHHLISSACSKHQLKPDVEQCLKSKHDANLGKTPHRVSLKRFVMHPGVDKKAASIALSDIVSGKVKFFTERLAFSSAAGWNRGAEWRASGPGSRNHLASKLGNIVLNGGTWMNIQHAMDTQVRSWAKSVGSLQNALIRVVEVITNFADSLYDPATWPITFILELMVFMFDTVIAGPSAGAGQDAKRNLEAAVPSGDLVSTARLYEELFLAVKDPSGEKKMTFRDFYNDFTCVEEIHDGFGKLYMNSPEHLPLMIEMLADFEDRRKDYDERCRGDPDIIHSYLSICTVAEKYRAKESAIRQIAQSLPQAAPRRAALAPGLQQRVAYVNEEQMTAHEEVVSRVAALESQHFRNGGPHGGGTPPPQQGSRGSTVGGISASMKHLQPFKSPPSQSGSEDSVTFVGKDGVPRHSAKGAPEVRITDAVEALKGAVLGEGKILALRYVKIPAGVDAWEHLSKCRLDPWMMQRLYDGGNCSEAIKDALAFVSPAAPYGGDGEPARPAYAPEIKRMQKNADGSEQWEEQACLCCANAPPWNMRTGPHPAFNTPESLLYRNGVSAQHNPHPCPARLLTALMTDCQPLIECIVPKPVPREL